MFDFVAGSSHKKGDQKFLLWMNGLPHTHTPMGYINNVQPAAPKQKKWMHVKIYTIKVKGAAKAKKSGIVAAQRKLIALKRTAYYSVCCV